MKTAFIVISTILTLGCIVPYVLDILKKKTKPRVVSWFTWSLLSAIAGAASLSDHQYAAAALSFSATTETMIVVVLGLKYGERDFGWFDIACQVGAIVGMILWFVFNSPAIAVVASVGIDFIAALPTLKHSWEKPAEETWVTFFLAGTAAVFTIFAATSARITALANPIYILLINYVTTAIILYRTKLADKIVK